MFDQLGSSYFHMVRLNISRDNSAIATHVIFIKIQLCFGNKYIYFNCIFNNYGYNISSSASHGKPYIVCLNLVNNHVFIRSSKFHGQNAHYSNIAKLQMLQSSSVIFSGRVCVLIEISRDLIRLLSVKIQQRSYQTSMINFVQVCLEHCFLIFK